MKKVETDYKNKIITIPNFLSLCRIILIPILVLVYCMGRYYVALTIFVVSALTDVVDGFIARKFNMITDLGKILDPIADKLTQGAIVFCFAIRFMPMRIMFILLFVKELLIGISGLYMTKKAEKMYGANWHGKLNTVMLFINVSFHLVWIEIPSILTLILCILSIITMTLSTTLYLVRNYRIVKVVHKTKQEEDLEQAELATSEQNENT